MIDTATNTVIATIPVGSSPLGVAVTPDGRKVYVANSGSNNVFVIDTASNSVLAEVSVGIQPVAFGAFIRPCVRKLEKQPAQKGEEEREGLPFTCEPPGRATRSDR